MPPLVRAGLVAALLAALAVITDREPRVIRVGAPTASAASAARLSAVCPRGTLPDGDVCVPVPPRERPARAAVTQGRARDEHDRIERRPDRPADYAKYRLPTDGTAVRLVRLEHQEGDAKVLHTGELAGFDGKTVVTLHALRDAGALREYLAIFGNLARVETGVARGATLRDGQRVGSLADTSDAAALVYEVRRLRAGVSASSLETSDFLDDARTVACDARNVLVLR